MHRTLSWLLILLLGIGEALAADNGEMPEFGLVKDRDQWQAVDPLATAEDYRVLSHSNLSLARHAMRTYSQAGLASLGVSQSGVHLLGAAIGLATSTARLPVNKSETMALELENLSEEDRALVFKLRLDW